jgi:hypothetical protein
VDQENDSVPRLAEELRTLLRLLKGLACWSATCGGAAGSSLLLDIGSGVPREKPISNLTLSDLQQRYEGEYRVFVQCAWRLELSDEVICGSGDDPTPGGAMSVGVQRIVGCSVVHADIQYPARDLILEFTDGLFLRVFCDQTNIEEDEDNYSLTAGSTTLAVGPRGRIDIERNLLS